MKTLVRLLAALTIVLPMLEITRAEAADSDLLETKIKVGLAALVDAIASEDPATANHAKRIKLAGIISGSLPQFAARYKPRIIGAYPSSSDSCTVDSLDGSAHCANSATQSTVNGEVVAIYGNDIALGLGD